MTGVPSRVRTLCTLLMCLMVLLFATQTKTALYKAPSPTVRTLAASKFWKNGQTQNISVPDLPKNGVLFSTAVFVLLSVPALLKRETTQDSLTPLLSFLDLEGINHFHRPPPSTAFLDLL
jgi:hypothetical protein